jgi:hypothetical protein
MAIHKYRSAPPRRPLSDPLSRQIAEDFGRTIVALRVARKLPRVAVVERTGINWKRLRALDDGWQVATLDECVRLADIYEVSRKGLLAQTIKIPAIWAQRETQAGVR